MRELTKDDELFCDTFVKTFDFHTSCIASSSNRAEMMVKISDETDAVNVRIRNSITSLCISEKFMTESVIKSILSKILATSETKYQLQSAKLLMGLDGNSKDNTKEFANLIKAITQ
jgi:hypothetical protein